MFYKNTLTALREKINKIEPGCVAIYADVQPNTIAPLSYLLWMCNEVAKMDTNSIDECAKAGRWVGWIFAHAELSGVWDNNHTRDLVREDRRLGYDKPHQF